MNRIPKYRCWLKDNALEGLNKAHFARPEIGRMFEVARIDFQLKEVTVWTPSELQFSFDEIELMEYTTLKDKNGKDIYEGDIFEHDEYVPPFKNKIKLVVGFRDGQFQCGHVYRHDWLNLNLSHFNQDCEIIGNIYENSELLNYGVI